VVPLAATSHRRFAFFDIFGTTGRAPLVLDQLGIGVNFLRSNVVM
jgi:hypothetical protein